MKSKIPYLILSCVLSVSCGKKESSPGKKKVRITEEQIEYVMQNQIIECDAPNASSCPAGVSRLLILNKEDADQSHICSGFMVGPNTLVTNNHCVSNLTECESTHVAIYNGGGYQIARCAEIIKTVDQNKLATDPTRDQDYTVLRIDTTYEGEFLNVSPNRANPNDQVTAWVVDHTGVDSKEPNLLEFRITELNCEVEDQSEYKSLVARNCPVVSGNSGSPLLGAEGVVGVIWGATNTKLNAATDLETRRASGGKAIVTESFHFLPYL